MSKFFRSKKSQVKSAPTPRELKEIQADYNQTALQAGQAQYQAMIYTRDLDQINNKLLSLNNEAALRNKLDTEAKAKQETPDV